MLLTSCGGGGARPLNSTYYPPAYPVAVDLLGGVVPPIQTIPPGDVASTGAPVAYYDRKSANCRDGSVCVIGHSQVEDMQESGFSPFAVAFGYGGETMRGTLNRLQRTDSQGSPYVFHRGSCGVILSGLNDLYNIGYYGPVTNGNAVAYIGQAYNLFAKWATGKWVVVEIMPIDERIDHTFGGGSAGNTAINQANALIVSAMATSSAQVVMVNLQSQLADGTGNLNPIYDRGDGEHLSKAGSTILYQAIANALVQLGVQS